MKTETTTNNKCFHNHNCPCEECPWYWYSEEYDREICNNTEEDK